MLGKHRLVGRYKVTTGSQRRDRRRQRWIALAANQFHKDIDVGFLRHGHGIVEPGNAVESKATITAAVPGAHSGNHDFAAANIGQKIVPAGDNLKQCRTDSA